MPGRAGLALVGGAGRMPEPDSSRDKPLAATSRALETSEALQLIVTDAVKLRALLVDLQGHIDDVSAAHIIWPLLDRLFDACEAQLEGAFQSQSPTSTANRSLLTTWLELVTMAVEVLVDMTEPPPEELVMCMLRTLVAASHIARMNLKLSITLLHSNDAALPTAAAEPRASEPGDAPTAAAAGDAPAHPSLPWLLLLVRTTDPSANVWGHVQHWRSSSSSSRPTASSSYTPRYTLRLPMSRSALVKELAVAGVVVDALAILRSSSSPADEQSHSADSQQQAENGGVRAANDDACASGNGIGAAAPDSSESDGRSTSEAKLETAPDASFCGVDLLEAVTTLCAQTAATPAAAAASGALPALLSAHICALPVATLTNADAVRLVNVAQRLQLLAPSDESRSEKQWTLAGFENMAHVRAAIGARALESGLFTLRLWAVKELASVVAQANALASDRHDAEARATPRIFALALSEHHVLRRLLGDLAHEEVLRRSQTIFDLLLHHDHIDDSALRALWSAAITKSAAVAAAATTVLTELLRSARCPPRIQTSLIDAIGAECSGGLTIELAALLATLAPVYSAMPHGVSNRLPLLLWHLLALPPLRASTAATTLIRTTLVSTLRAGPVEQRIQAIAVAVRPLQRSCGVSLASPRPSHCRSSGSGDGRGSGGSSGSGSASFVSIGPATLPDGSEFAASAGAADSMSSLHSSASSGSGSSRVKPTDLPPALAAAGDKLPLATAMELVRSIASADSLIVQLESRLSLYSLATQLVSQPPGNGTKEEDVELVGAISASLESISCSPTPHAEDAAANSASLPASGTDGPSSEASSSGGGNGVSGVSSRRSLSVEVAEAADGRQAGGISWLARLQFLTFIAAELKTLVSRAALEAVWSAMRVANAQQVFLLWLPSAVSTLSPDALAYGYLELLLNELRWDTLTTQQYGAFEALYRHYHVSKGHLKYAAAAPEASGSSTLGFLSRLWRARRTSDVQHELSELVTEAVPSSLQGTQQLWLTVTCAPEDTARMAMPLLVQLHLKAAAHIDTCVVRQELLQGCFHALHRLTAQSAPTDASIPATWRAEPGVVRSPGAALGNSAPSAATQARVLLLLELVDGFLAACGEARKLIPHQASWRGQSCTLTINVDKAAAALAAPAPPPHRRTGSSTSLPSMAAAAAAVVGVGSHASSEGGGAASQADESAGSAASGAANGMADPPGSPKAEGAIEAEGRRGMRLEFLVHDNLTLGLLRQRVKRELVAAALPKVPYSSIVLLVDTPRAANSTAQAAAGHAQLKSGAMPAGGAATANGGKHGRGSQAKAGGANGGNGASTSAADAQVDERSVLRGEVRTLRELGVGNGASLTVSIAPYGGAGREKPDGGSTHSKHASLPGQMIAQSSAYISTLFDMLRNFSRCPKIVAHAWDVLMRVPTNAQRLAALARPDLVRWDSEMALASTQPMRLLYSLQIVRSRLLPAYLPEPHAPAISAMAHWKARFMASGFRPLFIAFVSLASSPPRDTLHATLLATSLSIVRASLAGYLHTKRPRSLPTRPIRQPSADTSAMLSARPATSPTRGRRRSHATFDATFERTYSLPETLLSTSMPSQSAANPTTPRAHPPPSPLLTSLTWESPNAATAAASPEVDIAAAGPPLMPPLSLAAAPEGSSSAPATTSASVAIDPSGEALMSPGSDGWERAACWELALLLVRLMTSSRFTEHVPAELLRQMSLDQLKLLDALLACHPAILAPFLGLPELSKALALCLLRSEYPHVRKQAALFVIHLAIEAPPPAAAAASSVLLPLLERLLPEAVRQPHASVEYLELLETIVRANAKDAGRDSPTLDLTPATADDAHNADQLGLCQAVLLEVIPRTNRGTAGSGRDERVMIGLLRLLAAIAATSADRLTLLGARLPELCDLYLVCEGAGSGGNGGGDEEGGGGLNRWRTQPPTAVRHACLSMLLSACRHPPNLQLLLPVLSRVHIAQQHTEWSVSPTGEMRRATHAGLVNQGATCYMNATLQQLYMVPPFREGILAAEPPVAQRTPVFAELQTTFAHLRDGLRPTYDSKPLVAACAALPMTYEPFQQNDAAEFLMLLTAHLEESLKGTAHAELLHACFGGKLVQQVIWEEPATAAGDSSAGGATGSVRKVSEREEELITLQLDVKGNEHISGALKELVEGERLEGDNMYQLESGAKVCAQKRICLGELPHTLIIQLKRFQIDFETMSNVKLNSLCAFPTNLDLEPYTKRGLEARAAGRTPPPPELYELVGVVVHSGSSNYGHYWSYIRSREGVRDGAAGDGSAVPAGDWQIFNDSHVGPFDVSQLEEMCFGGNRPAPEAGAAAGTSSGGSSAPAASSDRAQNGFLLFYRRAPQKVPVESSRRGHRRSGSAPPAGLRYSSHLQQHVGPLVTPLSAGGGAGSLSPLPQSFAQVPPLGLSTSVDSSVGARRAAPPAPAPAAAPVSGGGVERAAAEQRVFSVMSVHEANSQMLIRKHLYDHTYISFLLSLLGVGATHARRHAERDVSSAQEDEERGVLASLPPPRSHPQPVTWPVQAANVSWELSADVVSAQLPLVQLCTAFLFEHLVRVHPTALEPHFASYRGWITSLEAACDDSLHAALWTLHTLLKPTPDAGGGSAAGSWLLGALFDCQSAMARTAIVGFVTHLVRRIAAAEVDVPVAANSEAPLAGSHVAVFTRTLFSVGLPHATAYWADALPLCELVRNLVLFQPSPQAPATNNGATHSNAGPPTISEVLIDPPSLEPAMTQVWVGFGCAASLAAYIIGDAVADLPDHLASAIELYPRPQRGSSPRRSTAVASNNEGVCHMLEALAHLLDASPSNDPAASPAASPVIGQAAAAEPADLLEAIDVSSASAVAMPEQSDHGMELPPAVAEVVGVVDGDAVASSPSLQDDPSVRTEPSESQRVVVDAIDLVGSAAFVGSAIAACVRAGGDGTDALMRCVEHGTRGSAERSELVAKEALRVLRADGEGAAGISEQLLVQLLTRPSPLQGARCAMALRRPHGLIGLISELLKTPPTDLGSQKPIDTVGDAGGGESSRSAATPFTESMRCYLCIRLLLEVNAASPQASVWHDDSLTAGDVDAMMRWLKDASRTAALGQEKPAARLSFLRRRSGYERTESQQQILKSLGALKKRQGA